MDLLSYVKNNNYLHRVRGICALCCMSFCSLTAVAGFLDLPDIIEVPELERESMLRDMDIPSVRDRNPDPEAGPRLAVSQFRIQGIVEYPELGITREALQKIVENIRFDMMDENKLLESGYTQEELAELSNLIVEIEEETQDRHVGTLEVQKLVWLIRQQRSKRGITLGMIETVADEITAYYRERGFVMAKAYIPEQRVRDGIVNLTLLLGMLGEVETSGNKLYSSKTISSAFKYQLGQPITDKRVEERLYLINDLPGVSARGFFEAGAQVGDSKLNINVLSERRFESNIRIDNHGTEQTGETRFYGEGLWNNPIGGGDQLQLSVLRTANPSNTTFGALSYRRNILGYRWQWQLGYANNAFEISAGNQEAISSLGLNGETEQLNMTVSYQFKRSRTANYSIDYNIEQVESSLALGALNLSDLGLGDEIRNMSLAFNYDVLREKYKVLHQGNIKLLSGEFLSGADPGQDEDFYFLQLNHTRLTFWRIPFTKSQARWITRSGLQYASSPLSSISQFSLGGATRTRAFSATAFSADDGIYISNELVFNAPKWFGFKIGGTSFAELAQPILFLDVAYGRARSLIANDDGSVGTSTASAEASKNKTATLSSAGLGLQFKYKNSFRGNLQYARVLQKDFSDGVDEEIDDWRVVLDVQYSF